VVLDCVEHQHHHVDHTVASQSFWAVHPRHQKLEIPFRPAPRSLFKGELTLSPKPVFFITNKTAEATARRLVGFLGHRNPIALPRIFLSALRG
jgi:hypothetical protein